MVKQQHELISRISPVCDLSLSMPDQVQLPIQIGGPVFKAKMERQEGSSLVLSQTKHSLVGSFIQVQPLYEVVALK